MTTLTLRLCAGFKINEFIILFIMIEFDYLIYYVLDMTFLNVIIAYISVKKRLLKWVLYKKY